MATIRKQTNKAGNERWVVDFYDQQGKRHQQFFRTKSEAEGGIVKRCGSVRRTGPSPPEDLGGA